MSNDLNIGDMLFFKKQNNSVFENAISKTFDGGYVHCAIYIGSNKIIESTVDVGVQEINLSEVNYSNADIYQLDNLSENEIKNIIQWLKTNIGKPYNNLFTTDNGSFYCSQILEQGININSSQKIKTFPLFFGEKNSQEISYWEEYYKKNNSQIPKNTLGTNPDNLAKQLKFINTYSLLKYKHERFDEIDSTNTYLLENHQLPNYQIVSTKLSGASRGSHQRKWVTQEGSLNSSILIKEKLDILKTTFAISVACRNYVESKIQKQNVKIKWPNDIYVNDKKICGILIEQKNDVTVIGVGMNINNFQTVEESTSLINEINHEHSVVEAINQIFSEFQVLYLNKDICNIYNDNQYYKKRIINYNDTLYNFIKITPQGKLVIKNIDNNEVVEVVHDYETRLKLKVQSD